jgi:hypothetical protein
MGALVMSWPGMRIRYVEHKNAFFSMKAPRIKMVKAVLAEAE